MQYDANRHENEGKKNNKREGEMLNVTGRVFWDFMVVNRGLRFFLCWIF